MTYRYNRPAFSMIELVFVIVVIGILAAVAIPKLAMNRDSAVEAAAKSTISSIRSSLATQKQKRVLSGTFDTIFKLSSSNAYDKPIFDAFDGVMISGVAEFPVLEYAPLSCENSTATGCWKETITGTAATKTSSYTYKMPTGATSVVFILANNRFNCDASGTSNAQEACKKLTQ